MRLETSSKTGSSTCIIMTFVLLMVISRIYDNSWKIGRKRERGIGIRQKRDKNSSFPLCDKWCGLLSSSHTFSSWSYPSSVWSKGGGHIFKVQWLSSFCRNMWVQMSFDANFYNRMRAAVEKLQKCSSRTILADEALPLVFFCLVWHILFLCLQAMNIDCQSSSLLHYYLVK